MISGNFSVQTLDSRWVVRVAYLLAALAVILVYVIPSLRPRFLDYGARTSTTSGVSPSHRDKPAVRPRKTTAVDQLLDAAATWRVPHGWFTSFYAVSVVASLIWAAEILIRGPLFNIVALGVPLDSTSTTVKQTGIAWVMLFVQGSRRLYECLTFSKASQSEMWIGHWLVGIFFYLGISIAVWIEGTPALKRHQFAAQDLAFEAPSLRTFVAVLLFIFASGIQHDCHEYLASLKSRPAKGATKATSSGYKMPEHPAFNICLTPHYLAECLIYLALAILATPKGAWINWTLTCALLFVTTNLGVTSIGTKAWYEKTFGVDAVRGRARMIPFIF